MMMKTSATLLLFAFFALTSPLFSQSNSLLLSLKYMPGSGIWGVYVKPAPSISPTSSTITGSAQVTLVAPVGFTIGNLVSVKGLWTNNANITGPVENPGRSYFSFGLVNDAPQINYANGETLLFTFGSPSPCPDTLHLIDNANDPMAQLPNSANANAGNEIAVFDLGAGGAIYTYGGIYDLSAWNCGGGGNGGCATPTFSAHPQDVTVCSGASASFSAASSGPVLQWEVSANGIIWQDLVNNSIFTGTTTAQLNITNTNGLYGYRFRLRASDGACQALSQTAILTLVDQITFTSHPAQVVACEGDGAVFEAQTAQAGSSVAYQWQFSSDAGLNWANITGPGNAQFEGFNSNKLTINNVGGLHGNLFRLMASSALCGPAFSHEANLSVVAAPVIVDHPQDFFTCDQNVALLAVKVNNIGATNMRWQMSTDGGNTWTNVPIALPFGGAASDTLLIMNIAGMDGYLFRFSAWSGNCDPVYSLTALISIGSSIAIAEQPQSGQFCPSGQACFGIGINGQPNGLDIQWQIKASGTAIWQNLVNNFIFNGTKTTQLCINNPFALAGSSFRAVLTTDCGTLTSEAALLEINDELLIPGQPENLTICHGDHAAFVVTLQRDCGYTAVNVFWETTENGSDYAEIANSLDDPSLLDSLLPAGKVYLRLPADSTPDGHGYRLRIKTPSGEHFTETAWLKVEGPLAIDQHPADVATCAGSEVLLPALASTADGQTDIFYQWESSTDGLLWEEITEGGIFGETTEPALLIKEANDAAARHFRIKARTHACNWTYSEPAELTVEGPLAVSQQPADRSDCHGTEAVFSIEINNQYGQGTVKYQWESSTDGLTWNSLPEGTDYTGTQNATLKVNAVAGLSGSQFRCLARTGACEWIATEAALLEVQHIFPAQQPAHAATCPEDEIAFKAAIDLLGNGPVAIQWQSSQNGGSTWENIAENQTTGFGGKFTGTQSPELHISRTEGLNGFRFRLRGNSSLCSAATDAATLAVDEGLCPADPIDYECVGVKLQWLPWQQRWAVFVRPEGFVPPAYNTASSGRVTIVAPIGFSYTGLTSFAGGTWKPGTVLFNPPQAPGMQFMTFDLTPNINNQLLLTEGGEIMLFSFAKSGPCPATIYLMDEYVPQPLLPNDFTGTGLGLGFGPDVHFNLCGVYDRMAGQCNGQAMTISNGSAHPATTSTETLNAFKVSPNPATDWLNVAFAHDLPSSATLRLTSLQGQLLQQQIVADGTGNVRFDLSLVPPGMYFISLESEGKVVQREKVVKW